MAAAAVDALAASAHERWERDGFLLVPHPVLPPALLTRASAAMDRVMAGEYETGLPPHSVGWRPGEDELRLRKIDQPHLADDTIFELFTHPALGQWAAACCAGAETVQVYGTQLLYKPPGGGQTGHVGMHQDMQYWRNQWLPDSEAFTITIALTDVAEDGGAISFLRGSHRWTRGGDDHGVLLAPTADGDAAPLGDFFSSDLQGHREALVACAEAQGEVYEEVFAALPAGGLAVHHAKTFVSSRSSAPLFRALLPHLSAPLSLFTSSLSASAASLLPLSASVCVSISPWPHKRLRTTARLGRELERHSAAELRRALPDGAGSAGAGIGGLLRLAAG